MSSESDVQNAIRIRTSQWGWRVFRNNRGVLPDREGRPVRFGLANDSKAMGDELASADLIGIAPILITPAMVGMTIGQFVSIEAKATGVKSGNTKRDKAQRAWRDLILSLGGYAVITDGEGAPWQR